MTQACQLHYRPMKKLLATLMLGIAATAASAAPQDGIDKLINDRGLVSQIQSVGQNVRNTASDLVGTAMSFIGVPYRYGGNTEESGFDCSGFVRATFEKTIGKVLPRRSAEQAAATTKIDRSELQPGDLVFFNTMRSAFSHVGIYVGEGKFIHAPRTGSEVRIESMDIAYWKSRFNGARRVMASDGSPVRMDAKTVLNSLSN